jgi:hypothetical protein
VDFLSSAEDKRQNRADQKNKSLAKDSEGQHRCGRRGSHSDKQDDRPDAGNGADGFLHNQ